ncbi:MAG: hypothetical protein K9N46_02190 [Candidatus Marinimicrobia bacterium]|nr:hypothetical protein [Candidatus Neomarinimicrobiota bacterium]MCF7828292.1 hypothetical protein [Candidatus Neomarinimicrobiota bacterium]MCF7879533.1 hypothetical protein [Candidatus Neomarinimicrobiota bacterium]
MKIRGHLFLSFLVLLTVGPAMALQDDGQAPTFIPIETIETAYENSSIQIEALVNDQSEVNRVLLYYRFSPDRNFTSIPMRFDVNYVAEIPPNEVESGTLFYYFWAEDIHGNQSTYPDDGENDPLSLRVFSPVGAGQLKDLNISLLTPDPDEILKDPNQIVVLSLYDPEQQLNMNSIQLLVDGNSVTRQAQITADIISYVPPASFGAGEHTISLHLETTDGKAFAQSYSFAVGREQLQTAQAKEASPGWQENLNFSWSIGLDTDYDRYIGKAQPLNRPIDQHRINARVKFDLWKFRVNTSALLNTHIIDETAIELAERRQPLNRLKLDIRSPWLDLIYGDYTPQFTELTLKGTRVRGLTSQLKLGWWKTTYIQGETKQLVTSITRTHPDSTQWSLLQTTPGDTMYVQHTKGTPTRIFNGLRTEVDFFRHFNVGISGFRAYDMTTSLDLPYKSLEGNYTFLGNLVAGADATLHLFQDRTRLSGEVALSALNDVNAGDSLLVEVGGLEEDLLDNIERTLGFPLTDDLVLGSAKGRGLSTAFPNMDDFNAGDYVINKMIKQGTYRVEFNTPVPIGIGESNVMAEYLRVPANYASLGNPSIQTDIQGLRSRIRTRIMKNQVSLSAGYENTFDNIAGDTRPQTTTNNTVSGGIGLRFRNLPMINYSLRFMNRSGELPEGVEQRQESVVLNDNKTVTHTIAPSYRFQLYDISANINGSIMNMNYTDRNSTSEDNRDFTTNSFTGALSLGFHFPMQLLLGGGFSKNTPVTDDQNSTTFRISSAKVGYKFFEKALNISVGFNLVDGFKEPRPEGDPGLDNQKITLNGGAQYRLSRNLSLGLKIDYVSVMDYIDTAKNYNELRGKFSFSIRG